MYYMGCVKITSLATLPTMQLCLYVVLRHVGDIAASWMLQVGIRAIPDLGAPCLIESLALLSLKKCFESYRIIYIGE